MRLRVLNVTQAPHVVVNADSRRSAALGAREGRLRVEAILFGDGLRLTPEARAALSLGRSRFASFIGFSARNRPGHPVAQSYSELRRAREAELKALGARSLGSAHRRVMARLGARV